MGYMFGPPGRWIGVPWSMFVTVPQVEATGPLVGCLQVGRDALPVEGGVVSLQQGGADALALGIRLDGEDGQMVVQDAGRVVTVEFRIEGQEPLQERAGDLGQVLGVPVGRRGGPGCGPVTA